MRRQNHSSRASINRVVHVGPMRPAPSVPWDQFNRQEAQDKEECRRGFISLGIITAIGMAIVALAHHFQ